jgi:hypothetical protein
MSLRLDTRSGQPLVMTAVLPGKCSACGLEGAVAQLVIGELDEGRHCGELCGTCIAGGAAIVLGKAHLERGGALGDLQVPAGHVRIEHDGGSDLFTAGVDQDLER